MPAVPLYSLLVKKQDAHDDPIYCCAWTQSNLSEDTSAPPKDIIVTGSLDTKIKIWELDGTQLLPIRTLSGHAMAVLSVAISPDGQTLASTSMDFVLIVWDLVSGQKVYSMFSYNIWKVVFSPDGLYVAFGFNTGKVFLYPIVKGNPSAVLDTRETAIISIAWSSNKKFIATGSSNGSVCVLNEEQKKLVYTFKDHTDVVKSVAFSPNCKLLVTGSSDKTVKLYDLVGGSLLSSVAQAAWAVSARFSPDGRRVAAGTSGGAVLVYQTDGMHFLKDFNEHTDTASEVQFNMQNNLLLSVSKDGSINIYECLFYPPSKK